MFLAWRDLRFAKGRFVLMGAVVVLITVLVGLVSGLTAGLARQSTSAITDLPADHLAFAAPADGEGVTFTASDVAEPTWQAWAARPGVSRAEPLAVMTTRAQSGNATASVSSFGVLPGSGLAPAEVTAGTVVLSSTAAGNLRAGEGDTITLAGTDLTVSAVAGDDSFSHTPVVWAALDDVQQPGHDGTPVATVVALSTTDTAGLAAADAELGTETVSRADALSAVGSYTSENGSLQLMRGFLFAISALVIGAFFTVWTIQRSGDVAVLKALGASTGYLLRDALGQAVVLLALGTALGMAIVAGLGLAIGGAVPFVLSASTTLLPALVLIVLGVLGAGLAVRRITSVDPLTALESTR
ncbi:putative ABC transport system permease protein [Georgenia satyanarayanai]|uniref:Putative ABC transport system permease protein n=2 Tax=Georgenia satyanarayanai TaxID=860221 RepID=A0A2Y9C4P1_9MICO|nr:putative ABC transport system permease protein [Georgenia satyanarayanai]SSA39933.1 putative ABC transport system permease protein [Georgenia satyanarayanai]